MKADPSGLVERMGEETPSWYNDSGWDYVNPYAWTAWVGTPVGTTVGTVFGAGSYYDSYWADKEITQLRRKYVTENAGSIPLCDYGNTYRLPQSQATSISALARVHVEFCGVGTGLASVTTAAGVALPIWVSLPRGPKVIVGGGATTTRISSTNAHAIQAFSTKYNVRVTVVGSRVNPDKALTPNSSDWDYLISPLQIRNQRNLCVKLGRVEDAISLAVHLEATIMATLALVSTSNPMRPSIRHYRTSFLLRNG